MSGIVLVQRVHDVAAAVKLILQTRRENVALYDEIVNANIKIEDKNDK